MLQEMSKIVMIGTDGDQIIVTEIEVDRCF